jgi:chromosome segregation protein
MDLENQILPIVKLTFNNDPNSAYFSKLPYGEVEIMRTFDKKKRESEFFINGKKVKLREIQEIALETGLTKSSLAIISQGSITNFAGAKPEERRELFNEAAGVAKYKKRKLETLNKLIKTQENLNRINDLTLEIQKRLPALQKASEKAQKYQEKMDELSKIEINILVKDASYFRQRLAEIEDVKVEVEKQIRNLTNEINLSIDEFNKINDHSVEFDNNLSLLNAKFNNLVDRISSLRIKKVEAENHENNQQKNASLDEIKIHNLEKQHSELRVKLEAEGDKNLTLVANFEEVQKRYDYFEEKFSNLYSEIEVVKRTLDRFINQKTYLLNHQKTSNTTDANKVILENANRIGGVIGTLLSLVTVEEKYREAISSVSGASMNAIVMKTNQDVKQAVNFLRQNSVGRVTFLPLDSMNPTTITGLQRTALEDAPGFIGFANEIVKIDPQFQKALDYSLGTVVLAKTYDDASNLAKQTGYRFNFVTLTGERILPKGAVQAGKNRNSLNLFAKKNEENLEEIDQQIAIFEQKEIDKSKELQEIKFEKDKLRDQMTDLNIQINSSRQYRQNLLDNLRNLNDDYRVLTGKGLDGKSQNQAGELESINLMKEISRLELDRDEIQNQIIVLNESKTKSSTRQQELSIVNQDKQNQLAKLKEENSEMFYEVKLLNERSNQVQIRLMERYNLTVDAALATYEVQEVINESEIREKISQLQKEINELGNVNLDAIEEYQTEKSRFEYYDQERMQIKIAFDELEAIIADLDLQMETQFKKVVDDVNEQLPSAFAKLFGGGSAELIYTDPKDILNTGIDIKVNPPGKKISNINLLSGGEKSLVALSVLFSILKVRPLPLVILDEAEAPLDPANVERFAKYIKLFTEITQFIIVTHREGTMENCEILYGVTMEQKGITKIVKIHLEKAREIAESLQTSARV